MKSFVLIGRIAYSCVIAFFGTSHFMSTKMLAEHVVPKWLPFPYFWVYFTGVFMIAAAVFIILNIKYSDITAFLLAGLLVFYALGIHLPAYLAGGNTAMMSMISMLKDIGLASAALTFSGLATKK